MEAKAKLKAVWPPIVLAIIATITTLLIISIFFLSRMEFAAEKHMWIDENNSVKQTLRKTTYTQFLLGQAVKQGSPAPLDYLFHKFMDANRNNVKWLNLTPNVYYRLVPNTITTVSAFLVFLLLLFDIIKSTAKPWVKSVQIILLAFVPVVFLFQPFVAYYAAEMRPYALWNCLYFLVLTAILCDFRRRWVLRGLLILLAFSATAALFQMLTLTCAAMIITFINEEKRLKPAFIKTAKDFCAPLLISLFYCFKSGTWHYPYEVHWVDAFFAFFNHHSIIIPMMLLLIIACFARKEARHYVVVPAGYLLLFLITPLIFVSIIIKGYFYSDRLFLYLSLTNAIFLVTVIKCLPVYVRDIESKRLIGLIMIAVLILGASFVSRRKMPEMFMMSYKSAKHVLTNFSNTRIGFDKANPLEVQYWDMDKLIEF